MQSLEVDRGGGGAGVAQAALDLADLRAGVFHEPSKGVAQSMNLAGAQALLADVGDGADGERAATPMVAQADPDRGFGGQLGQLGAIEALKVILEHMRDGQRQRVVHDLVAFAVQPGDEDLAAAKLLELATT